MTQTLLAIENLSVGFRHQQTVRTVVNDVSLQIEAGETLLHVSDQTLRGVRGNKIAMIFSGTDGVVKSIAYPGKTAL